MTIATLILSYGMFMPARLWISTGIRRVAICGEIYTDSRSPLA